MTGSDLAGLLSDMASLMSHRPHGNKPDAGATPVKCEMKMTAAGFRTWRCSVEAWLYLTGWPDEEAVLHMSTLHPWPTACIRREIQHRAVGGYETWGSAGRHQEACAKGGEPSSEVVWLQYVPSPWSISGCVYDLVCPGGYGLWLPVPPSAVATYRSTCSCGKWWWACMTPP